MVSRTMSVGVTPRSSLVRTHAPVLNPPAASGVPSVSGSMQVAVSPCGEEDLRRYTAPLSLRAWTPTPAALVVHVPVSSPTTAAFPPFGPGRRSTKPMQRLQHGALSEAAVHSLMFRPAGVLTTQVAPTATASAVEQPWFLHPSLSRFVTSPCPGYAHRLNRGITDGNLHPIRYAALSAALPERSR